MGIGAIGGIGGGNPYGSAEGFLSQINGAGGGGQNVLARLGGTGGGGIPGAGGGDQYWMSPHGSNELLANLDKISNPTGMAAAAGVNATMSTVFGKSKGAQGGIDPGTSMALGQLKGTGLDGWASDLVKSHNSRIKRSSTGNAAIDDASAKLAGVLSADEINNLYAGSQKFKAEKEAEKKKKKDGGGGGLFGFLGL